LDGLLQLGHHKNSLEGVTPFLAADAKQALLDAAKVTHKCVSAAV
jgi:hypothetical protein